MDKETKPTQIQHSESQNSPQFEEQNAQSHAEQDFQNVIYGGSESQEEMMLRFKVIELQKICQSLSEANNKLLEKLEASEEQRKQEAKKYQIIMDQYTQLSGDLLEIEKLLSEYRGDIDNFKDIFLENIQEKNTFISELQLEVQGVKEKRQELEKQKEQLIQVNRKIERRTETLLCEIEHLERQKSRIEQRINRSRSLKAAKAYDRDYYQSEINYQLEDIINKLVKQLEYEKENKKKMSAQIKRMSKQLMSCQKQIMQKNKKIYDQEISLLRQNKAESPSFSIRQNKNEREKAKNESKQKKFTSFPLIKLINKELDMKVSLKQRTLISRKIIQFYQRKLDRQDYSLLQIENLSVHNFSKDWTELLSVRRNGQSSRDGENESQGGIIWNLAYIIDSLFINIEGAEDIIQQTLLMLEKGKQNRRDAITTLKDLLRFA